MNKNILIVLGGAVLVAVLMAVLVQVMMGGGEKTQKVVQKKEEVVAILVAKKSIKAGSKPKGEAAQWKKWPKKSVISDMIVRKGDQKVEEVLKGRVRQAVKEGKPILNSYFISGDVNFVAASLDPGMRAVSIQVSAETMVAGFIAPGDFVDVLFTYQNEMEAGQNEDPRVVEMLELNLDEMAVETLIENVRVLAVDQQAEPGEDRVKVGRVVTLAVSSRDAEKVILAEQIGRLTLVLRSPDDKAPMEKKLPIISDARLIGIDDEITEKAKKLKNETGIITNNVRIYNGNQVQVISSQ